MDYIVEYLDNEKYVSVKVKGRINFQSAKKCYVEAVKCARNNSCAKFFIDHSETIMLEGIKNIHSSGDELQQIGFINSDKIAIILLDLNEDSFLMKQEKQNSRLSLLMYFNKDNKQEAIRWLSKS